jgi:hypothetical protein
VNDVRFHRGSSGGIKEPLPNIEERTMQMPETMPGDDRSGEALAGLADDESVERDDPVKVFTTFDDDGEGRINEAMGGMRRCDDC